MNSEEDISVDPGTAAAQQEAVEDIFFDCPFCGQSMSINHKAAGLIVDCPGCSGKVQIPNPAAPEHAVSTATERPDEQTRILLESLTNSQRRVQEISEKYNSVQRRRAFLERMRVEDLQLFNEVNRHLEQIRNSMDRLTEIMDDTRS